jgi:hypothetical protein
VQFLKNSIDYHWTELWKAAIGLLDFVGTKKEQLDAHNALGKLIQEVATLSSSISFTPLIFHHNIDYWHAHDGILLR